jgi:hypothetical protein
MIDALRLHSHCCAPFVRSETILIVDPTIIKPKHPVVPSPIVSDAHVNIAKNVYGT